MCLTKKKLKIYKTNTRSTHSKEKFYAYNQLYTSPSQVLPYLGSPTMAQVQKNKALEQVNTSRIEPTISGDFLHPNKSLVNICDINSSIHCYKCNIISSNSFRMILPRIETHQQPCLILRTFKNKLMFLCHLPRKGR